MDLIERSPSQAEQENDPRRDQESLVDARPRRGGQESRSLALFPHAPCSSVQHRVRADYCLIESDHVLTRAPVSFRSFPTASELARGPNLRPRPRCCRISLSTALSASEPTQNGYSEGSRSPGTSSERPGGSETARRLSASLVGSTNLTLTALASSPLHRSLTRVATRPSRVRLHRGRFSLR